VTEFAAGGVKADRAPLITCFELLHLFRRGAATTARSYCRLWSATCLITAVDEDRHPTRARDRPAASFGIAQRFFGTSKILLLEFFFNVLFESDGTGYLRRRERLERVPGIPVGLLRAPSSISSSALLGLERGAVGVHFFFGHLARSADFNEAVQLRADDFAGAHQLCSRRIRCALQCLLQTFCFNLHQFAARRRIGGR